MGIYGVYRSLRKVPSRRGFKSVCGGESKFLADAEPRRKLAEWAQPAYRINERRAARLMRTVESTIYIRKDPRLALRGS